MARLLAILLALPTATALSAYATTLRWVERLIIGEKLCPWATTQRGFRLLECSDADDGMALLLSEAKKTCK